MSVSAALMEEAKRDAMMFLLKSEGVRITRRHSSRSTGSQSENQVLIAVGVSSFLRRRSTSCQISMIEFKKTPLFLSLKSLKKQEVDN